MKSITQATKMSAYRLCEAVKSFLAAGRLTLKCGAVLGRSTKDKRRNVEGEFRLRTKRDVHKENSPAQMLSFSFHDVQRLTDLFLVNLKDIELTLEPILRGRSFPKVNLGLSKKQT